MKVSCYEKRQQKMCYSKIEVEIRRCVTCFTLKSSRILTSINCIITLSNAQTFFANIFFCSIVAIKYLFSWLFVEFKLILKNESSHVKSTMEVSMRAKISQDDLLNFHKTPNTRKNCSTSTQIGEQMT